MSIFRSREHAENTAAWHRDQADANREAAASNRAKGDTFGAFIAEGNVRVQEARAKLADQAAELLGGDS